MSERRQKHRISPSGLVIETDGAPVFPTHDIHTVEPETSAPRHHTDVPEGLEGLTAFARSDVDAIEKEIREARGLLLPLYREAEEVVNAVTKPLKEKRAYYQHLVSLDWAGIAAQVAGSGRTLVNLHQLMHGAKVVEGLASALDTQLSKVREAIGLLHQTRREVATYSFQVKVREIERRLRSLIRDTGPYVERAVAELTAHVEKASTIVVDVMGTPGTITRARGEEDQVGRPSAEYASWDPQR